MSGGDAVDRVTIGAKVEPEFKRQVRIAAAYRDETMSEYIRQAVRERMKRDEQLED